MSENESSAPVEQKPTFICDWCGRDKPVEQVWQCTLCLKDYCVNHINPSFHNCYVNE
jgi:hypothetical protein